MYLAIARNLAYLTKTCHVYVYHLVYLTKISCIYANISLILHIERGGKSPTKIINKNKTTMNKQEITNHFKEESIIDMNEKILEMANYKMVTVNGGTFTMGSGDYDSYGNERPKHKVTVESFLLGATQVTQRLWELVMGENPSVFKGENLPVENVSWIDCQEFIKKLNSLTGMEYRLPTEAEWEYAARGGQSSRCYKYPGGDDIHSVAWYYGNSDGGAHPVGMKKPNELGLYDMAGNVWEWCSDWYGEYDSSSLENPKGATSGQSRVLRGGSWGFGAWLCRVSNRTHHSPVNFHSDVGLRLAMSVLK